MKYEILIMMVLITLTILFMSGLWAIDIGASGIASEELGVDFQAQGLGFIRSANAQYHLGLMLSMISFLLLSFICIFLLFKEKRKNVWKKAGGLIKDES